MTDRGLASIAGPAEAAEVTLETLPHFTPEDAAVFPAHVRVNIATA